MNTRSLTLSRRADATREILIAGLAYLAYEVARLLAVGNMHSALATGRSILRLEGLAGLDVEGGMNAALGTLPALALASCYFYAVCHYVITPAVLIGLFRRRRDLYGRARTTLLAATAVGFLGHWLLPTAPPRMLPGFTDTMAHWGSVGWWGGSGGVPSGMEGLANPVAAMPSLHVGWAVWCGWYLWRGSRRRSVRVAGLLYPVVTTLVVVSTANHYVLDAVAGAVVMAVGAGLAILLEALWRRRGASGTGVGHGPRVIDVTSVPVPRESGDAGRSAGGSAEPDADQGRDAAAV